MAITQTPGRIQKVDPPQGFIIYTIGVLDSRIGGFYFWVFAGALGMSIDDGDVHLHGLFPKLVLAKSKRACRRGIPDRTSLMITIGAKYVEHANSANSAGFLVGTFSLWVRVGGVLKALDSGWRTVMSQLSGLRAKCSTKLGLYTILLTPRVPSGYMAASKI